MARAKKTKPKLQRKKPVHFTKSQFIKAIEGTGGIPKYIAENLDCARITVYKWIREADNDIKEALQSEIDAVGDIAEKTILTMMQQRLDFKTASGTARWYLERKCINRGYKEKKELTLEGGANPIHTKNENLISIESLNLPLSVRKQILNAMEEKEKEDEDGL